jgi:hypothetical protein
MAGTVQVALVSAEWLIHPRERDLSRLYDPISKWTKLTLVERHNLPDTWTIEGPPEALAVFTPGSGCILDREGVQVTSGHVIGVNGKGSMVNGRSQETMVVSFASDLNYLGMGRIIFPDPNTPILPTITHFTSSYDLRSGAIETLILGYIRSHIGNLAQIDRRLNRLRIPVSLNRGGNTQVTGRLDNLGVLVQSLAEAGGLRIRIVHTEDSGGGWLDVVIDPVADLSNDVRFGTADSTATGIITEWEYDISAPSVTRAVVAGGGELSARDFIEVKATAQETLWGMVVEKLIDQRQVDPTSVDKLAELTRAANEALTEGAGPIKVSFTPTLGPDLEYRRDLRVGDIVGYDLPRLEPAKDKIREATTVVSSDNGQPTEQVSVVVGTPDAPTSRTQQQTAKALRAITVIQRSK